ncbi:hypothetical protein SAMN05421766_106135 [Zobellia uliginosa]|uniref:Lipoprotein n=1 Tax=Zobellia uliginosa TaxID=143224 RepID=A0ABY1L005_9FLAO|nr:hypothetical protein [Zobellia uliginosa]SIS99055.1 hypothetical protein SAMN05421766_106135 [Zobellia uliginosa]
MKYTRLNFNHYRTNLLLLGLSLTVACSSNSEEADETNTPTTYGTIQLSGEETGKIGSSLQVGHIAIGRSDLTGHAKTVILTDNNTKIDKNGPVPSDLKNNFIIIGLDLGEASTSSASRSLSMNITVDGTEYKHACASPNFGSFMDCGSDYRIDFDKKEVLFSETTVINTKTDAVLTMNGTVKWD